MPRKADLKARQVKAIDEVVTAMKRYEKTAGLDYLLQRWVAQMTAVELHGIWERYVESRLVAALNHNPAHLIKEHNMAVSAIPTGLALYIVRGGKRFFDFRSMSDLISKADHLLGKDGNPFRDVPLFARVYLDCLAAIRNYVVHGTETSLRGYKANLRAVYGVKAAPRPGEFLHATDYRRIKPRLPKDILKGAFECRSRLSGLAVLIIVAVAAI